MLDGRREVFKLVHLLRDGNLIVLELAVEIVRRQGRLLGHIRQEVHDHLGPLALLFHFLRELIKVNQAFLGLVSVALVSGDELSEELTQRLLVLRNALFGALSFEDSVAPRLQLHLEVFVVLCSVLVAGDALQRGIFLGPFRVCSIYHCQVDDLVA